MLQTWPHRGRDPECPAIEKTCKACRGADHFASQCKIKTGKPKTDDDRVSMGLTDRRKTAKNSADSRKN